MGLDGGMGLDEVRENRKANGTGSLSATEKNVKSNVNSTKRKASLKKRNPMTKLAVIIKVIIRKKKNNTFFT